MTNDREARAVTVIGAGPVGATLMQAWRAAGIPLTTGRRRPGNGELEIGDALDSAEIVVVAIPGAAVANFAATWSSRLQGKLIIDATNRLTGPPTDPANTNPPFHQLSTWRRAVPDVRLARAFCTAGWEVMRDAAEYTPSPTLPYCAPVDDRAAVERLIRATGMTPWWLGNDDIAADTVDSWTRLWFAAARDHGRTVALTFTGPAG